MMRGGEGALEFKPTRAGFVTVRDGSLAVYPRDERGESWDYPT
jgi:hypothetical protein